MTNSQKAAGDGGPKEPPATAIATLLWRLKFWYARRHALMVVDYYRKYEGKE